MGFAAGILIARLDLFIMLRCPGLGGKARKNGAGDQSPARKCGFGVWQSSRQSRWDGEGLDHRPRQGRRAVCMYLYVWANTVRSWTGPFYERLRHCPGVFPQRHGGEAKATLAAFRGGQLGNVLTPLAGPVQKRSNHTGKEVENGAIWLAVPRPLPSRDGVRFCPRVRRQGCDACTPYCDVL